MEETDEAASGRVKTQPLIGVTTSEVRRAETVEPTGPKRMLDQTTLLWVGQ